MDPEGSCTGTPRYHPSPERVRLVVGCGREEGTWEMSVSWCETVFHGADEPFLLGKTILITKIECTGTVPTQIQIPTAEW